MPKVNIHLTPQTVERLDAINRHRVAMHMEALPHDTLVSMCVVRMLDDCELSRAIDTAAERGMLLGDRG